MSYLFQYIKHSNAIWSESTDNWDESRSTWKTIGKDKKLQLQDVSVKSSKLTNLLQHFITKNFLRSKLFYYIIEYKSQRVDLCYDFIKYPINRHMIVEADRGEDCGKIIYISTEDRYNFIATKLKDLCLAPTPKRIIRFAKDIDVLELEIRKKDEIASIEKCRALVAQKNMNMEILGCEYQWDMKKITFYFKSFKRIDFRDLLRDLFRLFKIRIWFCADRRPTNVIVKSLLELN